MTGKLRNRAFWIKCIQIVLAALLLSRCAVPVFAGQTGEADEELRNAYQDYQKRLDAIETQADIGENGFTVIEDQVFLLETECFGSVSFVPAVEKNYHRLVLFFIGEDGAVVCKTDQLAVNHWNTGQMKQPVRDISAISFQDLDMDGKLDIVLIASCRNETGAYGSTDYKVGDVLFQNEEGFYRDYRISDKINRFGMNKSAECITAYVRDGVSTEFLYTASTKEELLENGFAVAEDQDYFRQFEKLGYLEVLPGTFSIADMTVLMVYLVNGQGNIVWSFQPMGDFDNLYALKGVTCRDIDGDGMKDILVMGRYNDAGDESGSKVVSDYQIYYQRTDGFDADTEVKKAVPCDEEDTVSGMVEKARTYWGWSPS